MLIRNWLCHRSASVVLMEWIYNTIYSSLRRAKQNVAFIWLTKPAFLRKDSTMGYECAKSLRLARVLRAAVSAAFLCSVGSRQNLQQGCWRYTLSVPPAHSMARAVNFYHICGRVRLYVGPAFQSTPAAAGVLLHEPHGPAPSAGLGGAAQHRSV